MRKHLFALAAVALVGVAAPLIPQMAHGQDAVAAAKTGTTTGKVVDSSGHGGWFPQPKVGQAIWQITGFARTATDGTFSLQNAPAGKYQIIVMDRGVGFGRARKPVSVSAGGTVNAGTITLRQGMPGR